MTKSVIIEQQFKELRKDLFYSFNAFLADDPLRTTPAAAQLAADNFIRRFEALAAVAQQREVDLTIINLINLGLFTQEQLSVALKEGKDNG